MIDTKFEKILKNRIEYLKKEIKELKEEIEIKNIQLESRITWLKKHKEEE